MILNRKFVFNIDEKLQNREVKYILENELRCSANIISKLKQGEYILLNNKHVTVRQKVRTGDKLEIVLPNERSDNIVKNSDIKFQILFEDDDILVVDKPANIPTHPSLNHYSDTLANGVINYYDGHFTFRAVNRLDRETSGVVLIAKNILSAHLLSDQVKKRKITKIYYAITENIPENETGEINAPIARERESIIKRCVREDGKEAKTIFKIIEKNDKNALVKAEPVTGRTHQIRVHFSHIGCPLFGDKMYGSKVENERVRLHCKKIIFNHPITDEVLCIECDLPDDFNII